MDKEKLKKDAVYVVLGILGELFCFILIRVIWGEGGEGGGGGVGIWSRILILFLILIGARGGLEGGRIAKKWWGALVGGFILSGLIVLIGFLLLWWAFNNMWGP